MMDCNLKDFTDGEIDRVLTAIRVRNNVEFNGNMEWRIGLG